MHRRQFIQLSGLLPALVLFAATGGAAERVTPERVYQKASAEMTEDAQLDVARMMEIMPEVFQIALQGRAVL